VTTTKPHQKDAGKPMTGDTYTTPGPYDCELPDRLSYEELEDLVNFWAEFSHQYESDCKCNFCKTFRALCELESIRCPDTSTEGQK
jgi:hypothetical protein